MLPGWWILPFALIGLMMWIALFFAIALVLA
jgi:hypothetical protein